MKRPSNLLLPLAWSLVLGSAGSGPAEAADGTVVLRPEGSGWSIHVEGDADDEWWVQGSTDLVEWGRLEDLPPLLSGRTNAAVAFVATSGEANRFFRAMRTGGFYDPTLVRTIELTFPQSNWQTLLANNYQRGSNLLGTMVFAGRTYPGVGVRYRGNTSYEMGGTKKSVNIELDDTVAGADVMGFDDLNLNNAAGDETLMREPLFFNIMRHYAVSPAANFAKLYINGAYWGVYSSAQQQDSRLVDEYFPSNDGDYWRAPNAPGGTGGGGGGGGRPPGGGRPGGGGGFTSGVSALMFLGTNITTYHANYELKKAANATNAWERLVHAITVLGTTPAETFRDRVEEVLAVDRWLWFLAVENVFADDDSYFNKGADYRFYYEPESGRIHPIEHDGNEAFAAGDVQLSPVQGAGNTNRPVLNRLLAVPELRQRYCAHLRTVLEEFFNPTTMNDLIDEYHRRSVADIVADTKKSFTMAAYTNDLNALKSFVRQRHAYLTNHAEIRPVPPRIVAVDGPARPPSPAETPYVTTRVEGSGTGGVGPVLLYYREKAYGRFASVPMLDDGAHGDGTAGDGVYGAAVTNFPAGTKVRFYVEARSDQATRAAAFSPARAEQETYSYRVVAANAASTPVVINEFMASNTSALADPQGEFDDWIELHNVTDREVDLTGRYLSDEPNNPTKWAFPAGTRIAAGGYLLVWADEDGSAPEGLHASFKLAAAGEELFLVDADANLNAILDSVVFGAQSIDRSWGRLTADPATFGAMEPTPGSPNR